MCSTNRLQELNAQSQCWNNTAAGMGKQSQRPTPQLQAVCCTATAIEKPLLEHDASRFV